MIDRTPKRKAAPTPPALRRKLLVALRSRYPDADFGTVEQAIDFATIAHAGQARVSGEPYITHPLAVALSLADLGLDPVACAAAVLHDVPEDTSRTVEDIRETFGPEIAALVDGVTRLSQAGSRTREQAQAETIRKMFLAMSADVRVVLIKLADRLHNMRTISALDPARQTRIARQTLEIYAPLAERLGIGQFKWELEDLAFAVLEPERYAEIANELASARRGREIYIQRACAVLGPDLEASGIVAELSGRPKHSYSIWRKMVRKQATFAEIYDAYAVRVLVDTVSECYAALGVVHAIWRPIPGQFDDYIAVPKPNGYQSLHTAVIALDGLPLEVQIRTREMHRVSEAGIAAHWRYKEGTPAERDYDAKLAWLRQLMDWQHDVADAAEFVEGVKLDLFADRVFVFTPRGEVKDLPAEATPLDFAYLVHTSVGHRATGAKVNGKIVPFSHRLENGDIVEILTTRDPAHGPSRDWLKIVRTQQARSKIRSWFKAVERDENVASGRETLDRELRRLARTTLGAISDDRVSEVARSFGHADLDDFYAAIGYGQITTATVVGRLGVVADDEVPLPAVTPSAKAAPTGGVRVAGAAEILTRFAGCCSPVPGDPIIGFVTRGQGVTVHLASCSSVRETSETGRLIGVEWAAAPTATYPITLRIEVDDRPGLLNELTTAIAAERVNITAVNARADASGSTGIIVATLAVSSLSQLARLVTKLETVRGVHSIGRET